MKYYKIIKNKEFIGVGTTLNLRRFQNKHQIMLICNESQVQYIQLGDILYRANWMWPETGGVEHEVADVIRIEKEEYDLLLQAVESNEEIVIEEEPVFEVEQHVIVENSTIDFVRTSKILELKRDCNKAIVDGIDIKLSDGETRHFFMSLEDQINLLTMAYLKDESLYSTKDMKAIITKTNVHKNCHITKFKQLKDRVNSLNTIEEISAVNYHEEV